MNKYRPRPPLRKFLKAQGGNLVMTFALATIPIMGVVGAAVDYSRANSAKAAMQAAIDAAVLMVVKDAPSLTNSQISQKTTSYFNALFNRAEVSDIAITPAYTTSGGSQIVVTATGIVPTTVMKIMGFSSLRVDVSSTVKWSNSRLRVALALDNTGSMAQSNKMNALKTATKNLLTQLQNAAVQNGDVYVSIIPFSKDINVDPVNYNQDWVNWSGSSDTWDENNGSCSKPSHSSSKTNCINHSGSWTPKNHNTWNGCVTDRDQNYDTTNAATSTSMPATLAPAEQDSACPVPLMSLSYNWTALNAKIDAMQPTGNTNQAIGLQWAWQSLTSAPFTIPPTDSNYKYKQVIILVTDGLNTQDRWYSNQASIDARQQILCNNIKAANITLYTVQVNTNGDPTSTLLQNCASDSSKFFLLTSSSQIVTTFNMIAVGLSNTRVAN